MSIININKRHVLSVFSLVMINVIAIDSLRNLPTNAAMGLNIGFYYILATLLFMLPCALITAELATHRPQTGGAYVWVRDAFGPGMGFLNIWLQWIYNVVWYPTILSFIAANIAYLIDPNLASQKIFMIPMVIAMFTLATIVNCFGMRTSSLISALGAIAGTIIPMLFIIGLATAWVLTGKPLAIKPDWHEFFPHFSDFSKLGFFVVVIFSLMGLEMSAVHAGEVKNPQRDYPRALYYSLTLIVVTLILSSLAIAIVVPQHSLSIITGLDQAFAMFFKAFHLEWLMPIVVLLIILGGFSGMAAWVIGPTKGLMVAANDNCTPAILRTKNNNQAPIAILIFQWIIVLGLCSLFLFFKFISTSYWILSVLTSQLALLFYILLFAAAIRLRYKTPRNPKAYRIPGGNFGIWIVGLVGIITCVVVIFLGFIPPQGIPITNVLAYEIILVAGIIIFCLPPLLIYKTRRGKSSGEDLSAIK